MQFTLFLQSFRFNICVNQIIIHRYHFPPPPIYILTQASIVFKNMYNFPSVVDPYHFDLDLDLDRGKADPDPTQSGPSLKSKKFLIFFLRLFQSKIYYILKSMFFCCCYLLAYYSYILTKKVIYFLKYYDILIISLIWYPDPFYTFMYVVDDIFIISVDLLCATRIHTGSVSQFHKVDTDPAK